MYKLELSNRSHQLESHISSLNNISISDSVQLVSQLLARQLLGSLKIYLKLSEYLF